MDDMIAVVSARNLVFAIMITLNDPSGVRARIVVAITGTIGPIKLDVVSPHRKVAPDG